MRWLKTIKKFAEKVVIGAIILIGAIVSPIAEALDNSGPDSFYEESKNEHEKHVALQTTNKKAPGSQQQFGKPYNYKANVRPTLFASKTPIIHDELPNPLFNSEDQYYIHHVKSINTEQAAAHGRMLAQFKAIKSGDIDSDNKALQHLRGKASENIGYFTDNMKSKNPQVYNNHTKVINELKLLKDKPSSKVPSFLSDIATVQKTATESERPRAYKPIFADFMVGLRNKVDKNTPITSYSANKKSSSGQHTPLIQIYTNDWIEREEKAGNYALVKLLKERQAKLAAEIEKQEKAITNTLTPS